MPDKGVVYALGAQEAYVRILIMEIVSCLNDATELIVELASEKGVETFLLSPGVPRGGGDGRSSEGQASSSLKAISASSVDSSRQLAFNKAWRHARREMRGHVQ